MTDKPDPNADLIGYTFDYMAHTYVVTGTSSWSDGAYVNVDSITHPEGVEPIKSCRPAKHVRLHKQTA